MVAKRAVADADADAVDRALALLLARTGVAA
jgi:hypothetical protein